MEKSRWNQIKSQKKADYETDLINSMKSRKQIDGIYADLESL